MTTRAAAAVHRARDDRQREATAEEPTPAAQLACRIRGTLAQLSGPHLLSLSGDDPRRDADLVFGATLSTMRGYLNAGRRPNRADVDHLVAFCLRGLGAP